MKHIAITLNIRIKERKVFKPFELTYMPYESTKVFLPNNTNLAQANSWPTCKLLGG